jgi:hypothetical protein
MSVRLRPAFAATFHESPALMPRGRSPKDRPPLRAPAAGAGSVELFRRIAQLEVNLRTTIQELQALAEAGLDGPVTRERLQHAGMLVGALKDAMGRLGEGQDEDATRFAVGQLEGELLIVERTLGGSRVH